MNRFLLPATLLLAATSIVVAESSSITRSDIHKHVGYLAADQLEGRGTGTKGERLAGDYLAKEFASYGLVGAGEDGSFFQKFQVAGGARIQGKPTLDIQAGGYYRHLEIGKDANLFSFCSTSNLEDVPLVFAGYGVTDPARNYDDYAGIDVRGKAVLVLRHEPRAARGGQVGRHSFFTTKAENAIKHGAVAVLVVNGPLKQDTNNDQLMPFRGGEGKKIFGAHVKLSLIKSLFELMGKDLADVQKQLDDTLKPASFELGKLSASATIKRSPVTARNVVAMLPGTDPVLKKEIVVLGAHYDHLGQGGHGGSLGGRQASGVIHNGADDNASGTAGILELAQAFSRTPTKRSLVFIGFSGEERGLLGSRHWVRNPTLDIKRVVTMINLDMIGRLRDSIEVGGVGTSPTFQALVKGAVERSGLKGRYNPSGYGPSDHASFYGAKIPVLFFFTGLHEDYHRPTDDTDKVNLEGAEKVARIAFDCAQTIANGAERPKYVEVKRQRRGPRGNRARLGIMLDQAHEGKGVAVGRAVPDQPAAKGGIKAGDVIVSMGKKSIESVQDLLQTLGSHKPGDVVKVGVRRDGKTLTLEVKLGR